jgi:hypothetical protein
VLTRLHREGLILLNVERDDEQGGLLRITATKPGV